MAHRAGSAASKVHGLLMVKPGLRIGDIASALGFSLNNTSSTLNAMYVRGDLIRKGKAGGRIKASEDANGYRYFINNDHAKITSQYEVNKLIGAFRL